VRLKVEYADVKGSFVFECVSDADELGPVIQRHEYQCYMYLVCVGA